MADGGVVSLSPGFLSATVDVIRAGCRSDLIFFHYFETQDRASGDNRTLRSNLLSVQDRADPLLTKEDLDATGWEQACALYRQYDDSPSQVSDLSVLPVWRQDVLVGVLLANLDGLASDAAHSAVQTLRTFRPIVQQAFYAHESARRQAFYQYLHAAVIKLARFADGDLPAEELKEMQGSMPPIGASSVFALGARLTADIFQGLAHSCIFFDATTIRYVSREDAEASVGGSSFPSASGREAAASTIPSEPSITPLLKSSTFEHSRKSSIPSSASRSDPASGSDAREHMKRARKERFTGQEMDYVVPSKGMGGQMLADFLSPTNEESRQEHDSGSVNTGDSANIAETSSQKNSETHLTQTTDEGPSEAVLRATYGMCSYARSSYPVPLLAFWSDGEMNADAVAELGGDRVRRSMAGHFASARRSDRRSQVIIEEGSKGVSDMRIRKLLGRDENLGAVMCAACVDANLQPSFWMLVLFNEAPKLSSADNLIIEQIGVTLSHALLRKRAKAIDYAQQLFMQKVQHELRTPLHAIIGVNETVRFTVQSALKDHKRTHNDHKDIKDAFEKPDNRSERSKQNSENMTATLDELGTLTGSIAGSADHLSALVDDLVDFSLLEGGGIVKTADEEATADAEQMVQNKAMSSYRRSKKESPVSFATLLSVLTSTVDRCWTLFRRPASVDLDEEGLSPPPPELIMTNDGPPDLDLSKLLFTLDLDCLRRVMWKLTTNAVQFTNEGLVTIHVTYRCIKATGFDEKDDDVHTHSLHIRITDTGCGMSKSFLDERIFHAYQQEDQESVGLGLSLTLCRYLVDQMGGWIKADSVEGQGSTFTFSVPVRPINAKACVQKKTAEKGEQATVGVLFLGFENSKSLKMCQKAIASGLSGVTARTWAAEGGASSSLEAAEVAVVVVATDGLDDDPSALENIRLALQKRRILPEFVITTAKTSQHKYSPTYWEDIEDVYRSCDETDKVLKMDRPIYANRLLLLQELCDARRVPADGQRPDAKTGKGSALSAAGADGSPSVTDAAGERSRAPLTRRDSPSSLGHSDRSSQGSVNRAWKPFQVLVVEDNPLNAKIVTTLLKRARLRFIVAKDGVEAVQSFREHLPAVVLLDINMPRMDGFEAARQMRMVDAPVKAYIVAITALSAERDRVRGLDAGMDDWLTKPTRLGPLMADLQARRLEYNQRRP